MEDAILSIFIMVAPFVLVAGIFAGIIWSWRKKVRAINTAEIDFNNSVISVSLLAAFSGRKGWPSSIAFSRNNFNPKLALTSDGVKYKIIFKEEFKKYADVEMVDVWECPGAKCLILFFGDTNWTFSGNVYNKNNLKKVLQYLKGKGCKFTAKAELFLNSAVNL